MQVGAAVQEDDLARPRVPAVEGIPDDIETASTKVEATSQGEQPEEEEEKEE